MIDSGLEKSFSAFVDTAHDNLALEPRTTVLVFLAASMALGCGVCIKRHVGLARELGISEEQIGAVAGAAMAVAAGSVRNRCLEALGLGHGRSQDPNA